MSPELSIPPERFGDGLDGCPDHALADLYESYSTKVAALEARIEAARPRLRMIALKFAGRLRGLPEERRTFRGVTYLPHPDGTGVRRMDAAATATSHHDRLPRRGGRHG